jgi:hypothetical protein
LIGEDVYFYRRLIIVNPNRLQWRIGAKGKERRRGRKPFEITGRIFWKRKWIERCEMDHAAVRIELVDVKIGVAVFDDSSGEWRTIGDEEAAANGVFGRAADHRQPALTGPIE